MSISAFPCPPTQAGGEYHPGWDGMTLRDYFAAATLQGLCANPEFGTESREYLAGLAYMQADKMLETRKQ